MHVPRGIIAGSAGRAVASSDRSLFQRVREDKLPILLSCPFVIGRMKSPMGFLLAYQGLSRKPTMTFNFRDGMRLRIRGVSSDIRATLETCIWDLYTRDLEFGQEDPLVVIDIGAHIGTFSVSTAWRYPNSRVYSYEPLKENYDLLVSNAKENRLDRVFPHMVAVSDKKGTARLNVSSSNTGGHSMFYEGDSAVTIETVPLSEVFSSNSLTRCDLLKMDCEGAEYEILFGAPDPVLRSIRNIVLEYHNRGDLTCMDIANHLKAHGFEVGFVGKPQLEKNAIGIMQASNRA